MEQNRKAERKIIHGDEVILTDRVYNIIIGAVIAYGFIINAIMLEFLSEEILRLSFGAAFGFCLVSGFAGVSLSWKSRNAFWSFVGYNLVIAAMGIIIIQVLQGRSPEVVAAAVILCAIIAVGMIVVAGIVPDIFRKVGFLLFCGLVLVVISSLVCFLSGIDLTVISVIAAIVFTLYIGYDWVRAQDNVKTLDNAVDSALDVYLDIIVVFLKLLKILSRNQEK